MTALFVTLGYSTWIALCVVAGHWLLKRSCKYWSVWDTFQRWSLVLLWASIPAWVGLIFVTYKLEAYEHARFMDLTETRSNSLFRSVFWPIYVPCRLLSDKAPWEPK